MFVHDHLSGNPNPSKEDLIITNKLKEASQSIDMVVHDHLIIAENEVYSFVDHGLI